MNNQDTSNCKNEFNINIDTVKSSTKSNLATINISNKDKTKTSSTVLDEQDENAIDPFEEVLNGMKSMVNTELSRDRSLDEILESTPDKVKKV